VAPVEADLSHRIEEIPERFVPAEARGELTEAEHLARYWWAARMAAGRRVLDAGCGVGYGTNLLAEAGASEAIGVDIAEAVVEAASATARAGASFRTADVRDLPFEDDSFGLVTCFEVIEHVEERDAVIGELARVLSPDGVLVISSPNRNVYVPGNPHHVYEYEPEELREALGARFAHVALRRQHDWIGSAILGDNDARSEGASPLEGMRVAKALAAEPGSEPYTIALAGHAPLPEPGPAMVLTGLAEVRKWLELWHEQQDMLTAQSEYLQTVEAQGRELHALREELRRCEQELARIPELELAAARGVEVDALSQQVEELEAKADEVYRSVSWRVTKPLRSAKRLARRR
jgi:SAM-dependent methyltransferase